MTAMDGMAAGQRRAKRTPCLERVTAFCPGGLLISAARESSHGLHRSPGPRKCASEHGRCKTCRGVECYFSTIQAKKLKSLLSILLQRASSTSQIGMKFEKLLRLDFHCCEILLDFNPYSQCHSSKKPFLDTVDFEAAPFSGA
jgi:hypothetical protein